MSSRHRPFRLNKVDGKALGVCAGIADHFDWDVTLVRIVLILAFVTTFPFVGIAYIVAGLVAEKDYGSTRGPRFDESNAPRLTDPAMDATRQRMRDLDQRLQALETNVTSSNSSLAREIEALR